MECFLLQETDNFGFGLAIKDVAFDVLSRLSAKLLLRMKCVCKGWCQLISDQEFMKVQSRKKEQIVGFFFQPTLTFEDIRTIYYISAESELIVSNRTIFSFLPEDVVVLSSCNGLVCCRNCHPSDSLYICNPANKEWIKVKFAPDYVNRHVALSFDPCQDTTSTVNFKLVKVHELNDSRMRFEIYASNTGSWRMSEAMCECKDILCKTKGVSTGGFLHWLTEGDDILSFNVNSELSWLTAVPVPSSEFGSVVGRCIGDYNGQLSYVMISREGLQVWLLQEPFDSIWTLKFSKTLEELEIEHPQFLWNLAERMIQSQQSLLSTPWMKPMAIGDGHLLIKVSGKLYLYLLESNRMAELRANCDLGSHVAYPSIILPYSLSLVPLNEAL